MTKTMINVKTDISLKKNAQKIADEMGLPLSTIINNYLKRFIQDRQVNFNAPLVPNKETSKLLDEITKDIKNGKNMSPVFDNIDEAVAWLRSNEEV